LNTHGLRGPLILYPQSSTLTSTLTRIAAPSHMPPNHHPAHEKTRLRRQMQERRTLLSADERARTTTHITEMTLRTLGHGVQPRLLAGYAPIKGEVDLIPLLEQLREQGIAIALPISDKESRILPFRQWQQTDMLAPDAYGVPAPPPSSPTGVPDLIMVPLLAFDSTGFRLGYGGGYYDATLAHYRTHHPLTRFWGVAYSWQQVDVIPREPHDQPLDGIITEQGFTAFISSPA